MATHSTDCSAAIDNANSFVVHSQYVLTSIGFSLLLVLGIAVFPCPVSAQQQQLASSWIAPRKIDRSQLGRLGLRVLEGRHVTLVTDLESTFAVDELPKVVDSAVPVLAKRFGIPDERTNKWRVLAMVLKDREKFTAAGLMPSGSEDFPNGLSIGYELWVAEQSSDYYRRHLLIHELVHSFMATQLGSCGPSWYMEGMAELLGTHSWDRDTGTLTLGVMPVSRNEVPMWGRSKLINLAVKDKRNAADFCCDENR